MTLLTTDLNGAAIINFGGVTAMNLRTNAQTITDDSGSLYPETISLLSEVIEGQLTTKSIDKILTYIGLAGYCILADGSHPGLRLYSRILGDCKSPPASTDNLRYTVATGLVVVGQIDARRGADATISIMIHPITDGTNAPVSWTYSSITLPTTAAIATNQYTLGACKVGAIVLTDLESMTLNFGVQISQKTPMAGSVWPDSVGVRRIAPVATFRGFDPRLLDNSTGIPLLGKQATHANTLIQLVKRAGYSSFVSAASSVHIALTMNGMATVQDVFTGSGNAEATQEIRVEGSHDGTNVPIIINTATTYSASP